MKPVENKYDVAIAGGGLAGLSLSILLAKKGYKVILFEKEKYPVHKVCGEYISMESWNFLEALGLPLSSMNLPIIKTLQLTARNGTSFSTKLPLGGFGISRYQLDRLLADRAIKNGVHFNDGRKVDAINFNGDDFILQSSSPQPGHQEILAKVCCGAFGKRSNLDVKWKRSFVVQNGSRKRNYVAVKYHVETDWPKDKIGLHNFYDGYCGISKIEADRYCLCYLTTSDNLKSHHNSIPEMERAILWQNPHLKELFTNSKLLQDFPITISQISFERKTLVENSVLMLGDAAGMITPLCGNGMSMALHSSKIAAGRIEDFLAGKLTRTSLELAYQKEWRSQFESRLKTGRMLQRFFGAKALSNLFVGTFKTFPFLAKTVIEKTHGRPF